MLMQVADEFYPLLAPKGQKAIVKLDEDITIYADGNKIARVFNNILKMQLPTVIQIVQLKLVRKAKIIRHLFRLRIQGRRSLLKN